jgi:hypothetical protein
VSTARAGTTSSISSTSSANESALRSSNGPIPVKRPGGAA